MTDICMEGWNDPDYRKDSLSKSVIGLIQKVIEENYFPCTICTNVLINELILPLLIVLNCLGSPLVSYMHF